MSPLPGRDWPARRTVVRIVRFLAAGLLGLWAAGLVVAAVQLNAWNHELVRTLLQIRADTVFRTRMGELREPIPQAWYRTKALNLLAASEKLQGDGRWMVFLPGSWRAFDDLRDRLAVRIEREFSEIAVETMRRELFERASHLTGVGRDSGGAELPAAADCAQPPMPAPTSAAANPRPHELPEFLAVQGHLEAIEQLDQAVQAMLALQEPGAADADNLRLLVRYTLGGELPGRLSRSVALFRGGLKPEDAGLRAIALSRLQYAARCSVGKAMGALDARLFARNDLLATEALLAQRSARLFGAGAKPLPFAQTVQGLHDIVAALDREEELLAQGDHAWLRDGTANLGTAHEALLVRVAGIRLLGAETVEQLRRNSGLALQRFRTQFAQAFGDAALAWREDRGRFALSPQRLALREGLTALLQEPFMVEPAGRAFPAAASLPVAWDSQRLDQALALGPVHRRFATEVLPEFPASWRAGVARLANAQLAQLVQDYTVEAMGTGAAAEGLAPAFDSTAMRAQREQLSKVMALLAELGARGRADRLRGLLAQDLTDRFALAETALWQSPLYSARTQDFGWWQGDSSPILQALGAADVLTLRYWLAQQFRQWDDIARRVAPSLAYADPTAAAAPTVARWRGMLPELERHRSGRGGSLAALERYLLALAPDLNRANCAERLAAASLPIGADEFAQRHLHIHRALVARCSELRAGRP